jgi:hypothetical protein
MLVCVLLGSDFRNKITPGSAPILLQCSSSFRPEYVNIAEVVRCWMFFEPSFGLFAIFDGIFALIIILLFWSPLLCNSWLVQ